MRNLIVASLLMLSTTLSASHLLGGMVAVAQTSYDSTSVGVWLIADPQGISAPSSITVEKWEMNSVGWYVQNGTITLTQGSSPISFQGYNIINYTSNYLDLDSNKYRFIYKNCCWGMINNSQNSMNSDFIISADYWHIPNNSTPSARVPFIINQQVNTRNTMKPIWGNINCFLNEADNDVAVISQTDLHSGYANSVFVPQIYTQLSMHVDNDSISWIPSTLGKYATGFQIDDYRNGQLIGTQRAQWTFNVVNSTISIEENKLPDHYLVYDFWGNLVYEGDKIPYNDLRGPYIVISSKGVEKMHVINER
jgi:hypothetical protein